MGKVNNSSDNLQLRREIGLGAAIALSVGSAIGSGIFTAPQNLAAASTPTTGILGWILSAAGAIFIAICFGNLAMKYPKTGGIVVYTREAFGDFAGFLIAWVYWIGQWVGAAAIITACVRYLSNIFPIFDQSGAAAFAASTIILWFLTYMGIRGTKEASFIQVITTVLKLIPLLVFVIIAVIHFNPQLIHSVSPEVAKSGGGLATLPAAMAITAWAFTGFEASTTAAGEIKDPEKNLKKSIVYGTIIVAAIYILVSILSMGILPQEKLSNSTAPLAEMINIATGGTWGGIFISLGVVISTLGSANGGIIMATRAAFAAAEDDIFPSIFKRVNAKFRTPDASLIITGILTNILLILNYVQSLNSAFTFIMLLSTLTIMPPYAAGAVAEIMLARRQSKKINIGNFIKNSLLPLLAFVYILYTIYGTGSVAVMWGFILMLIGIPFYVYVRLQAKSKKNNASLNL